MTSIPNDFEAERAVLGAIIIDNSCFTSIQLSESDFYDARNRLIFRAFCHLALESSPIDYVTVKSAIAPEDIEKIGLPYILSLTDGMPKTVNVPAYASRILSTARQRRLLFSANLLVKSASEGNGNLETAVTELATAITEYQQPGEAKALLDWKLWESANFMSWPDDELRWHVEPIIPRGGIGFMSAAPKTFKSFIAEDLALHMAQNDPPSWLGKFKISPATVLYIAREDPLRRIRDRMLEICDSTHLKIPDPGRLQFLVRDRISLTEPTHLEWLKSTIVSTKCDIVILDVLNRMIPDLDELSAKDMAKMVSILEELNRSLGVTLLVLDHTRKPQGENRSRDTQEPNPFDLKGSVAKYGAADFMICLARTPQDGRVMVYVENKESELRPMFLVDVSPKDSDKPKFTFAGNVERMVEDMKKLGEANREKILASISESNNWVNPKSLASELNFNISTVSKHLGILLEQGKIQKRGKSRTTEYHIQFNGPSNTPQVNSQKSFDDII